MRYRVVRRYGYGKRRDRWFATLNEALSLFYGNYWRWRVIDTQSGAEWEPY